MTTKTTRPARSGFCGLTNPPESHDRCSKGDCPCPHHTAVVEPLLWPGDDA